MAREQEEVVLVVISSHRIHPPSKLFLGGFLSTRDCVKVKVDWLVKGVQSDEEYTSSKKKGWAGN